MNYINQIAKDIEDFKNLHNDWIVIIYWPTATGKTSLSLELAKIFPKTNVISADSRQIYKQMDIWTDKVSFDIREKLPHYQIDLINPDQNYTAADWQKDTYDILEDINKWDNLTLVVWWTWLYIDTIYRNYNLWTVNSNPIRRLELEKIESDNIWYCWNLLNSFDPEEAKKHHPTSLRFIIRAIEIFEETWVSKSIYMYQKPVKYPILMISLLRDSIIWNQLIDERINQMLSNWLIEEVRWLMDNFDQSLKSMQTIDYKQVIWYINWEYNYDAMINLLQIANHQLAKKQRTRFRKYQTESKTNPKAKVFYKEYIVWL